MVREDTPDKEVSSIARQHARHRTVVEIRVGCLGLVHPDLSPLRHQVHAVGAVRRHVIELLELGHVETVVVARHVEVVAGEGRVGFDEVVRANNTLRIACASIRNARSAWSEKIPHYHVPRSPPTLSKRLATRSSLPPIEKLGSSETGLPPQSVPMTARTVARSIPIPYTIAVRMLLSQSAHQTILLTFVDGRDHVEKLQWFLTSMCRKKNEALLLLTDTIPLCGI